MIKGSSMTEEQRKRISDGRKGKNLGKRPAEVGLKISASKKGVPVPEERRKRISATLKGRSNPDHSLIMKERYKNGLTPWNLGKKMSPEHIEKIASKLRGRKFSEDRRKKHSEALKKRWDKVKVRSIKRWSKKNREWSKKVIERDGNKCSFCGSMDRLHAHHVVPWESDESLRYDFNNGITLCSACHLREHRKGKPSGRMGKKLTEEHKQKLRGPRPHVVPWNKKNKEPIGNITVL